MFSILLKFLRFCIEYKHKNTLKRFVFAMHTVHIKVSRIYGNKHFIGKIFVGTNFRERYFHVIYFRKKIIVPENTINKALDDSSFQDKKKVRRSRDQNNQRELEGNKSYGDFIWKELVEPKSIKNSCHQHLIHTFCIII